jgi:hypothetical protein
LEWLFKWHRAREDFEPFVPGGDVQPPELRRLEAEVALDVLTGGWFSHYGR